MIQWSHKIPARDKFSSVPKRGHAIMNVLRTICNDITSTESRFSFYFSKPGQKEKPPTETSKQRDEKNCSSSLILKPQRWGQLSQSFVLLDNPWLLTRGAEWANCLKHLWSWNLLGRFVGLRKVCLQEMSLLGAGQGWGWQRNLLYLSVWFLFSAERFQNNPHSYLNVSFQDRLRKHLRAITTILREKLFS